MQSSTLGRSVALWLSRNPVVRLALMLVVILCAVSWLVLLVAEKTTRVWFHKDITLRSQLAVNGSRASLLRRMGLSDKLGTQEVLGELAKDERIMGAAVCTTDGAVSIRTETYPEDAQLSCMDVIARVRPPAGEHWVSWGDTMVLPGGTVHVSAIPLTDGTTSTPAIVILVHDLGFIERRETTVHGFLILVFAILILAAVGVPMATSRVAWGGFQERLRDILRGESSAGEFQPLVQDVRLLVDQLLQERQSGVAGAWTAIRLRDTLVQLLHGEKIVLLANREPYMHVRQDDGAVAVLHPASGLVTALEPVMRTCSGVWVAHGSGNADRENVDERDRVWVPPGDKSFQIRRVWLSPEEERGYYYGFSNEGLWPLCHLAHVRPEFRAADFNHYRTVNQKFADAVCEEVEGDDPIILVQDYHFALAPKMIRERQPRATIITFWHIPWPSSERVSICPWRNEIVEGLLGSSILGFHTHLHCNNFFEAVDRFLESRIDREAGAVVQRGRQTLIRPYPISIEWPSHWAQGSPAVSACRKLVFEELNLKPDALLGVGVDRIDYTKGIEERLLAVERLLEREPSLVGRFTFAQLGAPSRTLIDRYREVNERVEELSNRINSRFGKEGYRPIALLRSHHEPPTVFKYLRAADLCYVSSLHDGMNLVAKEFVAARDDLRGVLVLSQFTGAARELTEALVVNPYDLEQVSSALLRALKMPAPEQAERLRTMRALVGDLNVYRWAGRMLEDGATLRRKDRLADRWSTGD